MLQLEIKDILALRGASKSLHYMIEGCVSAVVRSYAHSLDDLHRSLYPPPPPGMAQLSYLIDNEHRLCTSRLLASLIAAFFCDKMLGMKKRNKARARTYDRIYTGLLPLFFTLGHFFENYRRMILERAMKQWRAGQAFQISTGGPTLWDDQVSILDRYTPALMLDCYHAYGYLLQVFEFQLRPRSMEKLVRRVRGRNASPAATREVEVMLMLGGMEQVCQVLRGRSYSARRDCLDSFINRLKPTTNLQWKDAWKDLRVESDIIQLDRVPSLRLQLPALHLVWVPSALKLLLRDKIIDRVDFSSDSGARSPTDFVIDLLVYGRNSPAYDDDEDEHGDDSEDNDDDTWDYSDDDHTDNEDERDDDEIH